MKLTNPTILALAALSPTVFADNYSGACLGKSKDLWEAINGLCSKTDMVVPSLYAHNGLTIGAYKAFIDGSCSPPQWLPSHWCQEQLYEVCAKGAPHGAGVGNYGKGGCQRFVTQYFASPPPKPRTYTDPNPEAKSK